MEEEKIGALIFQPLASEEMASFVDLWEGQRNLWVPKERLGFTSTETIKVY